MRSASSKYAVASTQARARWAGSPDLKMPEPMKTPSAPSCIIIAASAGVATPPAVNSTTGSRPSSAVSLTSANGRAQLLGLGEQLALVHDGQPLDLAQDRADVGRRLADVAGAGLALGADHGRALGDAPQGLAEVGGAADEGHGERALVDVVGVVGRGEDLGLVDVVDPDRLQHLGLDEVADAGLGHDRDAHLGLDAVDHVGVGHAHDAAVTADVGRHALQGHDGDRAGVLGDPGLLRRDDVHDDAALEHLGHAALDGVGARRRGVTGGRVDRAVLGHGAPQARGRLVPRLGAPRPSRPGERRGLTPCGRSPPRAASSMSKCRGQRPVPGQVQRAHDPPAAHHPGVSDRAVVQRPGERHPGPGVDSSSRRGGRPAAPPAPQGPRQVVLHGLAGDRARGQRRVGPAATAAGSGREPASTRAAAARRTSSASSAAHAASTRACSRSSRPAVQVTYRAASTTAATTTTVSVTRARSSGAARRPGAPVLGRLLGVVGGPSGTRPPPPSTPDGTGRRGDGGLVDVQHLPGHDAPVEGAHGPAPAAARDCAAGRPQQVGERAGERRAVADRHQHARPAVVEHGPERLQVARHDGRAGGHGLGEHDPEALAVGVRRAVDVCRGVDPRLVLPR